MGDINYTLQFRHEAETETFTTRNEVIGYIHGQLTYGGVTFLPHEFVLFYYGEEGKKNAIIMVGLPDGYTNDGKSYFLIDTANIEEKVDNINETIGSSITELQEALATETDERKSADETLQSNISTVNDNLVTAIDNINSNITTIVGEISESMQNETKARITADETLQESLSSVKDDLSSVIEACGLIYNENLSTDKVSYEPDSHDEVIRDAESLADAIDKVSKFVTEVSESLTISVKDTTTVDMTMTENANGDGNIITADVRIAGATGLSTNNADNNIIGTTSDGIYASASLEQSSKNVNVLIFKTSGYVNGEFKVDAYETEVSLTPYSGDNGRSTGIEVSVDDEKNVISAQLNLSSDETNILELVDGEYLVDGRAKNIRYKSTTVAAELTSQSERLDDIEDSIETLKGLEVNGSETDTATVTSTKSSKGDYTVAANVKLSNDNSIIISNGGLSANISASYATGNSTLTLNVGNNAYSINLSELAVSVLESATYDSTNEQLILTFTVGDGTKTVTIPVGTLIHDVEVDDTTTIDLTLTSVSGGPNRISANVIVDTSSSDNILTANSNGLYVSKANITDAVEAETKAAKEREAQVLADAKDYTDTTSSTLSTAISNEVIRATAAEEANTTAITTETTRAQEKEADLLEKIEANASSIKTNAGDIASEVADRKEADTDLKELILTNANNIATNTTSITTLETSVATKANASDVYTQLEITNMLADYAKSSDMESQLSNKLNITDAANTYATKEALQDVKDTYATKVYVDSVDSQLDTSIKANTTAIDNFGLEYNEATSVLTFTDKNGTKHDYNLYSGSLVTGGEFDEDGNNIILYIETSGVSSTITIPVESLLSEVTDGIEANANDIDAIEKAIAKLANKWSTITSSTVTLTKTVVGEEDTLTADVRISTGTNQAIIADSDGLFVSNNLADYNVVYGEDGTISGQSAISKIYGELNSLDSSIDSANGDISELTQQVSTNTSNISDLTTQVKTNTSDISDLKQQVSTNTSNISSLTTQVNTNTSNISSLTTQVITNTNSISGLEKEVKDNADDIDKLGDAIEEINENISNITELVKISDEEGNILTLYDDGLYVTNIIDGGTF